MKLNRVKTKLKTREHVVINRLVKFLRETVGDFYLSVHHKEEWESIQKTISDWWKWKLKNPQKKKSEVTLADYQKGTKYPYKNYPDKWPEKKCVVCGNNFKSAQGRRWCKEECKNILYGRKIALPLRQCRECHTYYQPKTKRGEYCCRQHRVRAKKRIKTNSGGITIYD